MILDKELEFASAQVVTATAPSTNVIDTGTARDIGTGTVVECVVVAKTALVGTLVPTIEGSIDEAFTVPVLLQTLPSFAAAAAAGSKVASHLAPEIVSSGYKFIRMKFTGLTGGTVAAYLALGVDHTKHYNDAITISG